MTIKGTLETFNLRELLQMLAFNQKVGTLVLETDRGTRTVHVDHGRASLVTGDPIADRLLARVLRRRDLVPPDRLQRPVEIAERSGRFLGDVLSEMGLLDEAARRSAWEEAFGEAFLDLALSPIQRFEFQEERTLSPTLTEGTPLEPAVAVEGLLLDLTRRLDQWALVQPAVPTMREIYEGTGLTVDLSRVEELDIGLAERAIQAIDGYRTLDQVVEASDVDRLTVVHLTASLLEDGGLRAVPVDDLIARGVERVTNGEAKGALPLLRRAVERDGSPEDARLHLADALEASGDTAAAAAELDTFATRHEGRSHPAVFDALERALRLRDNDLATAARLCDHYLTHRHWLRDRRERAADALRILLHVANREGRPIEAASRLAAFVEIQEAPSEDLLVLADLYAAAGERLEAAGALFRRARILLEEGRVPAARSLLQRSLELDGSRSDARQALREIESKEQRKRKKRRVALLVTLLVVVAVAGVTGVHYYGREMDVHVRRLREPAEAAVGEAERHANALLEAFRARTEAARTAEAPDEGLADAAGRLEKDVRDYVAATDDEIDGLATALESIGPRQERSSYNDSLESLRRRSQGLVLRAKQAVTSLHHDADASLTRGEREHGAGRFRNARQALVAARNLGFHDPSVVARATQILAQVDRYMRDSEEGKRHVAERMDAGDVDGAFQAGVAILRKQLDSDLTREIRLPVRLTSNPAGAEVWVGGRATGERTPCVLAYSPFEPTGLRLRLPGHAGWSAHLPDFEDLTEHPAEWKAWRPELSGELPAGLRWRLHAKEVAFTAVWDADGVPVALGKDGFRTYSVDPGAGRLGTATVVGRDFAARRGGVADGGVEWMILGSRTLHVLTSTGATWDAQLVGNLERPPAVADGIVAVVDEMGIAQGFDQTSGVERWRVTLGATPAQPLLPSALGFLVACTDGSVWAVSTKEGRPTRVATAGPRRLALPLGGEALVLCSAAGSSFRVGRGGTPTPFADVSPKPGAPFAIGRDLIVWVEEGGVKALRAGGKEPVAVPAVGGSPKALALDGTVLYAADARGMLTAVDVGTPDASLWQTSLGGSPEGGLLVLGDGLFSVVDGDVVAVER